MRIANMIDLIGNISGRSIDVFQERCVSVRNRNADCLRCAEACTSGCIQVLGGQLVVNPVVCIGCSTCATACPTAALCAKNPTDYELLLKCETVSRETCGEAVIICDKVMETASTRIDRDKVAVVPCLGRIEESLVVALAADGVDRITLVDALCNTCTYHNGFDMASTVVQTADVLLQTWHSNAQVRIAHKLPGHVARKQEAYDHGRREFFSAVKKQATQAAGTVAVDTIDEKLGTEKPPEESIFSKLQVNQEGVLPHFVPDRRDRLLDGLARLGQPDDVLLGTRLWGHVMMDADKCRSCYMCATFCPTGALRKLVYPDHTDTAHGVGHSPSQCVKCRTCENICMEHAITISDEVFAVDMMVDMVEQFEMDDRALDLGPELGLGKGKQSFHL